MHALALVATLASFGASALAGHIHGNNAHQELAKRMPGHLSKRSSVHTNARLTYYFTNDGNGACGEQVHDSDFIVALNIEEYGTYWKSSNCFRYVTIQHGGKSVVAQVKDECPGCPWGGLDLTPAVFWALTSVDTPILDATWWYNDDPPAGTTTTKATTTKPTTTWTPTPTTTSTKPTTTWTPTPTTTSTTPKPTTTSTPTTTSSSSSSTHSTHSSSSSASKSSDAASTDAASADPSSTASGATPSATAIVNAGDTGAVIGTVYEAVLGMSELAAAGGNVA